MIRKTINGVDYYCFEPDDKEVRRNFEKAMAGEDSAKKIMMAMIDALSEMQIQRQEAWEAIIEVLPEECKPAEGQTLEYSWIAKGFKVPPQT